MEIINGIDQDDADEDITNIDGATIDDSVIGGTTPASGSFTTLEASTNPVDADGVGDRGFNDARYVLKSTGISASIWLPAESAYLPVTNPAGLVEVLGSVVYGGLSYITFDDTTSEHAMWRVPMPDYDDGNITVTAFSKVATTPAGAVTLQYNILTVGLENSEEIDSAVVVDTNVNISHSLDTTELLTDIMVASATINPANVTTDDLLVIELSRDVASDSLSGDGELVGIMLKYTRS
jgi:hypothetical protein